MAGRKSPKARQGLKTACVEEVAFRKGFIPSNQLCTLAEEVRDGYRQYLLDVALASDQEVEQMARES